MSSEKENKKAVIDNDHRNSESKARRDVAKGAGTVFLARISAVIELIAQPAYTWMFGLATYGFYTVLWSLINLIENIVDLAMTAALQRLLPKADEAEARAAIIKGAFLLGVLPGIALAFVLSMSAPVIAPLFNVANKDLAQLEMAITLFAWALPLWATVEVATSALRACRAFGPEIRLRLFWEQIVRLILAVILWMMGVDTLALLLAHLGSLMTTAIFALRVLNSHCSLKLVWQAKLSRTVLRELLISGLSVLPSNVLARMFSDLPVIIINFSLPGAAGANAAGLYSIARKLSSIPQMVRTIFSHVVSPIAASSANKDHAAIQALYTFSIRVSVLLALPTTAALIIAADSILALFVTGAAAAWPILVILTLARGLQAALGPAAAILQVISHRGLPVLNSILGLISASVVVLILFPLYEAKGVALGVAAGQLVIASLSVWQLYRGNRMHAFDRSFVRIIISALSACFMIVLTGHLTAATSPLIQGIMILFIYLSAMWLSVRLALPEHDRHALGKLGRRLRLIS
jgi:O-antigen/teichoic acid export membrane protein